MQRSYPGSTAPSLLEDANVRLSTIAARTHIQVTSEQAHVVNVDGAWLCAGMFREAGGEQPPGVLKVLWGLLFGDDRKKGVGSDGKSRAAEGEKDRASMQPPPLSLSQLPLGNAVFMLLRAMHTIPRWIERAKIRALGRRRVKTLQYYNIMWLGTLPEARGRRLGGAFVRMVTRKAAELDKPVPVWLETSTEKAKRLYEKCGFQAVAATRFGSGWVDEDGQAVEKSLRRTKAKGVRMWAMAWWPEELRDEMLNVQHKSAKERWIED
jgi:ribosomal protein S18 acetylase RimI-like enzyme